MAYQENVFLMSKALGLFKVKSGTVVPPVGVCIWSALLCLECHLHWYLSELTAVVYVDVEMNFVPPRTEGARLADLS